MNVIARGKQGLATTALSAPRHRILTVAVDIDGVLYELVEAVRVWVHEHYGVAYDKMPDPGRYNFWVEWNLNIGKTLWEVITEATHAGHMYWKGGAYTEGLAGLRALKEAGYRVILISARDIPGIEDVVYEATAAWLASVGAVYDELHITSDKNAIEFDILIDDYEKNVRAAHADGRRAILVNRCWNVEVDLPQAHWPQIPALIATEFGLAA